MASDDKEHQMLFDLRGRRRNVIKLVYAVLALLMGGSLFLTVGPFSIAELFNDGTVTTETAKPYEEEAERIETKLKKNPEDPDLLLRLTRARINAGNNKVEIQDNGERTVPPEATQQYLQGYQAWSDYLEVAEEPSPGLALVVAPTMIQMAEYARTFPEAAARIEAAVDAQRIVAEQRPSVNAWTTLAFYTYFTGNTAAAKKAEAEAKKLVNSKAEAEAVETQLKPVQKSAQRFLNQKERAEKAEKAEKAAGGGAGAAPESLENPFGGLGGE